MKKLDTYIAKKYFSTFFFACLAITAVAVVINFSENIDKFSRDTVTTKEVIFDFYLNFIPWINGLLWPLFSLISVIFFTSRMAKNSEIIAILNAGVSYNRLLVSFLIPAAILATLLWVGENYIIPNSNKEKIEFENRIIKRNQSVRSTDTHCFISPNEKIYAKYFRKRDSTIQNFRLETFDDDLKLVQTMEAKRAIYNAESEDWSLVDYTIRTILPEGESLKSNKEDTLRRAFNLAPGDFILNHKEMETMTTDDLKEYIKREESRGLSSARLYEIELLRRTSNPFTIIILTVIAVSIASRKVRGGVGMHLALAVVLGSFYVILSKFTVTFSQNLGLAPLLGVWLPNLVFIGIAIYLARRAQQ